jgi:hypothetical protein
MWRKKFKARLFVFIVKTLRTWAVSIERKVPPEQTNDREPGDSIDPSDVMLQSSGGPPQHWIDLVREKAPELLSPSHTKEVLSEPVEEVPGENLETVTQETPQRRKVEEKEERPKPPLLRFAKVPKMLRGRTTKKTRAASTPSKFLNVTPQREPNELQEPSREPSRNREVAPREAAPRELSKTKKRDVEPHELPKPKQRSSRQGEYIVRKPKRVEANDFSFIERTKETRPDSMPVSTEQHSQAKRTTAPESPPIIRSQTNREVEQQWPEVSPTRRSPDGPTVQPPRVTTTPAEETGTFVVRPQVETGKRIHFVLAPSHIHKTAVHRALPPARPKEKQQGRRPEQHIVTPSSQRSNYRQQSEDHFDRADVHLPALLDEDTMSEAAAAQWTKTHPGENPWPDLPWTSPFEIEEEIAAHTREVDRYRRLELEQRGTLWNE